MENCHFVLPEDGTLVPKHVAGGTLVPKHVAGETLVPKHVADATFTIVHSVGVMNGVKGTEWTTLR